MPSTLPCVTHIDLKGAPPNVNYLARQCIPSIKKFGSWGVMLEWEDTFPYTSNLIDIGSLGGSSRDGMYSMEDVKFILQSIKENEMEPIQLVQTIGHMEYVLKHGQYRRLREVPSSPSVLCPTRPESLTLVKDIIYQVLAVQPDANYIHIGADEAWHINECTECLAQSQRRQCLPIVLFLEHIKAVTTYIKEKYPNIKILMWDDMIRKCSAELMKQYDLGTLVQPVVWNYSIKENFQFDSRMWERYSFVFPNIWVASAFKGANGSNQISNSVQRYASNQTAWHDELVIYEGEIKFSGIILTGWSRYDHYATLCELLPVALPTLAVCLQMWTRTDGFTNESIVSSGLNCEDWPGHEIARCIIAFAGLRERILNYLDGEQVTTWLNQWQIDHDYTNPMHVHSIAVNAQQFESELVLSNRSVSSMMYSYTGPRSAEEFLQTYLTPLEVRVGQLVSRARARTETPAGVTPKSDKCRLGE